MTTEQEAALKAIVKRLVEEHLVETGLVGVLERCQVVVSAGDAALALLEQDPHQFSSRPCQTCQGVSALIGRAFGCVKKRAGNGDSG